MTHLTLSLDEVTPTTLEGQGRGLKSDVSACLPHNPAESTSQVKLEDVPSGSRIQGTSGLVKQAWLLSLPEASLTWLRPSPSSTKAG